MSCFGVNLSEQSSTLCHDLEKQPLLRSVGMGSLATEILVSRERKSD